MWEIAVKQRISIDYVCFESITLHLLNKSQLAKPSLKDTNSVSSSRNLCSSPKNPQNNTSIFPGHADPVFYIIPSNNNKSVNIKITEVRLGQEYRLYPSSPLPNPKPVRRNPQFGEIPIMHDRSSKSSSGSRKRWILDWKHLKLDFGEFNLSSR